MWVAESDVVPLKDQLARVARPHGDDTDQPQYATIQRSSDPRGTGSPGLPARCCRDAARIGWRGQPDLGTRICSIYSYLAIQR